MHYMKCQICGLKSGRVGDQKRTFMARFPLNEERCKKWVQVTGNEDLAYVPIEKLHVNKYICGKHFRLRDFKKKKTQLKRNAVPSLLITAKPLPDEILVGFPLHLFVHSYTLSDHNYYKDNIDDDDDVDVKLVIGRAGEDFHEHPSYSELVSLLEGHRATTKKVFGAKA